MLHDHHPEPPQTWLTAYLDGELPEALHEQVEAWLADHPEALARLDEDRRIAGLFEQATPPEPRPETWSRLLIGIGRRLSAAEAPVARPMPPRPWMRFGSAAAVLFLAVGAASLWMSQRPGQPSVESAPPVQVVDPLAVTGDDDVVIISMEGRDVGALVVGAPPVRGPLVLASAGDVRIDHVVPHSDGAVPDLHQPAGGTPMVVGPLDLPWEGD